MNDWYLDPPETDDRSNVQVEEAFEGFESPYELYRSYYKGTNCGVSIGFRFNYITEDGCDENGYPFEKEHNDWVYCDDLIKWHNFKTLREQGILITGICVGSIVEGVDFDCQTIEIDIDPEQYDVEKLQTDFDNAVKDVEAEAQDIWDDTHGCKKCGDHWESEGLNRECSDYGTIPVWKDCQECDGMGIVI